MPEKKYHTRERKLTVIWENPFIGDETSKTVNGLDYWRAMERGHIPPPPIARLLGFRLKKVDLAQAVFKLEPGEHHYNPIGMVHSGVASKVMRRD